MSGISVLRDGLPDGAACRFDPELHDGRDRVESPQERGAREQVAREVCRACPVWDACLEYAVGVSPERGVWAGFTVAQLGALMDQADTPELFGEVA
jgi:hypothetical protein